MKKSVAGILAGIVIVAAIVVALMVGDGKTDAPSAVTSASSPVGADARDAAAEESEAAGGKQDAVVGDDDSTEGIGSEDSESEESQAEEEKREAEEEKKVDAFDALTDKWMEPSKSGVTMADVDNFAKRFLQVPKARQDECIHRALHRISLNMAAKDLAAREAEEEGLTPKSVPTLRRERKDALRFSRAAYHKGRTLEVPCGLPRRMRRCG